MLSLQEAKDKLINSQIWRSMFRGGTWKDTSRDRAQHILGNVWLHLHPARIRQRAVRFTYTWGLGGLSFGLFMILTLTGLLLMFYYRPSVELAYRDIKDLEFAVSLGVFLRNLHRWSAHTMVLLVILHMVRVFLTGAYKTPREFNWGIGVVLLVVTLFLSFTGYLLPWDQLALWAVTVGTNMASATPFAGAEGPFSNLLGVTNANDARFALLGGTSVGANTLIRFYVLHCVAVPFVAGVLMIVHFWRIRKDGFSAAPLPGDAPEKKMEVWPNLVVREYIGAVLMLVFLIAWSILQNAPLEELANPGVTPNPSKAPWYFLGLQELLVYFDPWLAGVVLPGVIAMGLMAIPYIDPDAKRGVGYYSIKERPFASTVFLFGIALWFLLIFIGTVLRGPNWSWYWPWESWEIHKALPPPSWSLILVDLTDKAGVFFTSQKTPGVRVPGFLGIAAALAAAGGLIGAYFGAGLALPRLIKKEWSFRRALWVTAVASLFVGVAAKVGHVFLRHHDFIGKNIPQFGPTEIAYVAVVLFIVVVIGFLLPQKYLRASPLSPVQYVTTMLLLLMMLGVILKMGARMGFNIKYILSLPSINLNL
ncbi:MAG: cytochrome bc complex cytochrome b subunit [Elusimicrobia bacterium]|jgi:quinol-cytochrome oxidoreductase complex cytochrome b subunit|nr:cytochrome bc complex cytochrome b subunit [Elusimicrobiota bacterium]MBK7544845.1 cytochrome bc complex cytochrome b subunit [Elusimicrobiota bacterium]MBK7574357.1 cytochrome bc complex cytochrome b subunit [Elusimicrobiota bacterium]MBK7688279.1 cytochrome bc complex cytochrome b subunit [Elusimicrobiota bacterium]MBK8126504.1 cytochrome bc complex cytochrome b subunit [Elusimicrobiota bacterium]